MTSEEKFEGTVVWFNPKSNFGYGFIKWEKDGVEQKDMFLHFSDIVAKEGEFKTVKKGQKVVFKIGQNNRGEPKAVDVVLI